MYFLFQLKMKPLDVNIYIQQLITKNKHIIFRGKKITCPGARDKWNFRQDKQIFSSNVRRASKKFRTSLFDNYFDNYI